MPMRWVLAAMLAGACGPGPEDEAFGFTGETRDLDRNGVIISLWVVSSADPDYVYKFGHGSTVSNQFDVSYPSDPPPDAVNDGGVGVALLGFLPGLSTIPDGVTDPSRLRLLGISPNHAVIWKDVGAIGPAWNALFPTGWSCAQCVRNTPPLLDTWEPVDCSFVIVHSTLAGQCNDH